jgi:hypothetical protein
MLLQLPRNLHYPIKITKIEKQVDDVVARHDSLFQYSYATKVKQGERNDVRAEEDIPWVNKILTTHFPSSLEGRIKVWRVWEGDIIGHA